eukprot:611585_1
MSDEDVLETDLSVRLSWNVGSKVLIFHDLRKIFVNGTIEAVYLDGKEEWIKARCDDHTQTKNVQRYSKQIKPCSKEHDIESKQQSLDIVSFIQQNKGGLFECKDKKNDERMCVERITFICKVYTKWVNGDDEKVDIRDVIDNQLSETYAISSFLSDYRVVSSLR